MIEVAKTFRPYTGRQGFYCSMRPDDASVSELLAWCVANEITPDAGGREFHCTVMYSPDVVPKTLLLDRSWVATYATHLDLFSPERDTLVMRLHATQGVQRRFDKWCHLGAVPTYPDYRPHVTLMSGVQLDHERLKVLNARLRSRPLFLRFGQEFVEDIAP